MSCFAKHRTRDQEAGGRMGGTRAASPNAELWLNFKPKLADPAEDAIRTWACLSLSRQVGGPGPRMTMHCSCTTRDSTVQARGRQILTIH